MIKRIHDWVARIRSVGAIALCNFAIFILACWVFVAVADEVREDEHLETERRIMHAVRAADASESFGTDRIAEVARDITALGSGTVLAAVALLVTGFLALSGRLAAALFVAIASAGGATLNSILKSMFGRPRPDFDLRLIEIDSLSFPSGHAMSSATIYLTLAVLLTRLATRRREKLYIIGAALLLSFVVGLSRIYLGVHYPTDVVAGWAAGVAWAQLCWFAAQLIGRRQLAHTTPG